MFLMISNWEIWLKISALASVRDNKADSKDNDLSFNLSLASLSVSTGPIKDQPSYSLNWAYDFSLLRIKFERAYIALRRTPAVELPLVPPANSIRNLTPLSCFKKSDWAFSIF
ncbi:hypothetical protein WICPIJ_001448 [Wickerhamomyces pijperi]|uniref:Uncharacterized protein n=1 Tax=Wickerhamomyces pijperi TaxID=599730 RepID=A0A9P8QBL7_WICPI|nr:hypothetical protein WICPIJ_001448 [Wickerhamomyces pijperi]